MPWTVSKCGKCPASKPWCVVRDSNGTVEGCHPTKGAAQEQQKALYAQERSASAHNVVVRRATARAEETYEGAIAASYEAAFLGLTREAVRTFRQNASFAAALAAAVGPPDDWTPLPPDEVIALDRVMKRLARASRGDRQAVYRSVGDDIARHYGLSFDLTNPLVRGVFEQLGGHIKDVSESWRKGVMRVIDGAYSDGLPIEDTARLITEHGASMARARAIARTEMAAATNGAAMAASQMIGFTHKTWATAPGARYPRHEFDPYLNGQTVPITGAFSVRGYRMPCPGLGGPASEVVNCRCVLLFGNDPTGIDTGMEGTYMGGEIPELLETLPLPEFDLAALTSMGNTLQREARYADFTDVAERGTQRYSAAGLWEDLNDYLRTSGPARAAKFDAMDASTREMSSDLISAFIEKPSMLPHDIVVYRGTERATLEKLLGADLDGGKALIGREFKDPAYLSTTLNPKFAADWGYIVEIHVAKGTRGIYLGGRMGGQAAAQIEAASNEWEVLLKKGMKLTVKDVVKNLDGTTRVILEAG